MDLAIRMLAKAFAPASRGVADTKGAPVAGDEVNDAAEEKGTKQQQKILA